MKDFIKDFWWIIIIPLIAVLYRLDYLAYRQQFPHAARWTYLFSGRR